MTHGRPLGLGSIDVDCMDSRLSGYVDPDGGRGDVMRKQGLDGGTVSHS
jgi:hypothetical protein